VPQFEFGVGLSYTPFKYSDLKLSSKDVPPNVQVNVTVTITNSEQRAGNETDIIFALSDKFALH